MSWKNAFLPPRKRPVSPKSEEKKDPQFAVRKRVCFFQETKDGLVYGIGEIKALKSTPVINQMGKIESFSYVADIQPLYEVPHTWKLCPVIEEYSSDDPIPFLLPDAAILCSRLEIRMKLPEDARNYKMLKAVSGKNFCGATYDAFLRFYCGASFFPPPMNT